MAKKRRRDVVGHWVPKPGTCWIEHRLKGNGLTSPTHRGYVRLPVTGQLYKLEMWLLDGADGKTYLQGQVKPVRPPWDPSDAIAEQYRSIAEAHAAVEAQKHARSPNRRPRWRRLAQARGDRPRRRQPSE